MKDYTKLIEEIRNSEEFKKLATIGGHEKFHQEGNALVHTNLVVAAAERRFGKGHFMTLVALLHDIGKIYTSVYCGSETDPVKMAEDPKWKYPHHSDGGAEKLANFIPEDMPEFKAIQWYIYHHIQPLYWKTATSLSDAILEQSFSHLTDEEYYDLMDSGLVSLNWLVQLVICDLEGSYSVEPQTELINFLQEFVKFTNDDGEGLDAFFGEYDPEFAYKCDRFERIISKVDTSDLI